MTDTIFSKIIRRELPAEIVYETEHVVAFLDIQPNNPGHTLVIPKEPSINLTDITSTSWHQVMEVVHFLAPRIQQVVQADGVNIMINSGEAAGQLVFHTHVHIIPRFLNDDTQLHWPRPTYSSENLAQTAARIRTNLTIPTGSQ
jgi:histidine triad (HIT) family protein